MEQLTEKNINKHKYNTDNNYIIIHPLTAGIYKIARTTNDYLGGDGERSAKENSFTVIGLLGSDYTILGPNYFGNLEGCVEGCIDQGYGVYCFGPKEDKDMLNFLLNKQGASKSRQ